MVKLLLLFLMEVCVFSQQKSDEEILKEILVKHNLSINDFRVYNSTSERPDYYYCCDPNLWYIIQDNKVKKLVISSEGLTRLDLSGLTNLEKLELNWCNLTDLKLSNLPNLKELYLYGNSALTQVDLSGLTNLEKLNLRACNITDLKLSNLPNLKELDLYRNKGLIRVDLSGLTKLEKLNLKYCENLKEVIISKDVKDKINIEGDINKINLIWK